MTPSATVPKAYGVHLPRGHEIVTAICPKCKKATATAERVGNRLYGECPCGWTDARAISRERM